MSAVKVKAPHPSGLEFYREVDYFQAGVRFPGIDVWYYEWLLYPTGVKSPEVRKKYSVMDIPAVTKKGTPIELTQDDGNGNQISYDPPQYDTDVPDVIVTPANTSYSNWRYRIIPKELVGARLGEDIIVGAINQTLMDFPVDVIDGHIVNSD